MLDQVEALVALHDAGTMAGAAARLRVTPSAVSKRIAALEARVGAALVEPSGRRVRLTPAGEALLREVAPLLARLRTVLQPEVGPARPLVVGSSPALLSSWLPMALRRAQEAVAGLTLQIHARRGPVAVERVLAGAYDLAICVDAGLPDGLVVHRIGVEPMGVVQGGDGPPEEVWAIEPASYTWQATQRAVARHAPELRIVGRIESFSALVQLARAGYGHALVPVGIARALGAPVDPLPHVARPIAIVGRAGVMGLERVGAFRTALQAAAAADLEPA